MNWIELNLYLIVLAAVKSSFVTAEESSGQSSFHDEEEMLTSDLSVDPHYEPPVMQKKALSGKRIIRKSYTPLYNQHLGGNMGLQFPHALFPAPLLGQRLDAQASSASKQIAYAANNNNKKKFYDFTKPAEETLKRLTRNPDVMDDIVGQFQELGGGMTKNLLQQVSQSAPDMSKSFGQALNEALTQTNMLAQVAPGNFDLSQLTKPLNPSNLSGSLDLGQLGQSLSQNFLVGATQNLFGSLTGQSAPTSESGADDAAAETPTDTDTVATVAPDAKSDGTPEQDADDASQDPKNPADQVVGQSFLPALPGLAGLSGLSGLSGLPSLPGFGQLNPLGAFAQMASLLPMGSEINEVRVLPEHDSPPYKVSPQQVEHQTLAEMKLKAVLKDALNKKTIPILWFHLPSKSNEQKTNEQLEMEAKLENFEKQVIAELKQLQELAKMANEVKKAQLQSGFQPTTSLTTKLNLFEIPIYDITLADIENTLKDEHVIMLMQTLVQKKKDFQRHQQATTKYITDLTGTNIKRHTTPNEETLMNMEKDDMLKMMTYAYRMAALNGHEMPWINKKMVNSDKKDTIKSPMNSQQSIDQNRQMGDERQWLTEKEQQMRMEANPMMMMPQPQSFQRQTMPMQNQMSDMNMAMQQQQRQQENNQRQMMPTPNQMSDMNMQMQKQQQQQETNQRQMMPMPNQMSDINMHMQQQQQANNQRHMMQQTMMNNFDMTQQMPMMQMAWTDPNMQQNQRHMVDTSTSESKNTAPEQKPDKSSETKTTMSTEKIPEPQPAMPQPQPVNETAKATVTNTATLNESKPEMTENEGKARFKVLDSLLDVSKKGKQPTQQSPVVMNYYYNAGGSGGGSYPKAPSYGQQPSYGGGYVKYPSSSSQYSYKPAPNAYTYTYRTATGDEEIGLMLQQEQQRLSRPKMMLMVMMPPINEEPIISTPTKIAVATTKSTNEQPSGEERNQNHSKRLAKKQSDFFTDNAAAYVIVLRNNDDNRDSISKSSRLRQKRSTEYATLEPIDESSLNALRKTYKNTLKEITLNPNETPEEALMRYNAESIREALEKANKQPMEIDAGAEEPEVKSDNAADQVEQQQQHIMQDQISKSLPQTYTLSANGQLVPITTSAESSANANGQYVTQPVAVPFNPTQTAGYETVKLQGGNYNNMISKYHTPPAAYSSNNQFLSQNPYVSMSLQTVPYTKDNSLTKQPYQLANHKLVDDAQNTAKPVVYQTPPTNFNNFLSSANAIDRNLPHLSNYEVPSTKRNSHMNAFSPVAQPHLYKNLNHQIERHQDYPSLDNIIAVVKQQLVQCCNKCKDNILQSLEERLKHQHHAGITVKSYDTIPDNSHTLAYRQPSKEDDFEYKQWLMEMSNKGYSQGHLTKQHHQDYLKEGKLSLHIADELDLRHDVKNIFFKNQSFKRETTLPEIALETTKEAEMVTAPIDNDNKTEKPEEEDEETYDEEEEDTEADFDENEISGEKLISKEAKEQQPITKIEKNVQIGRANSKNHTLDSQDSRQIVELPATLNTTTTLGIAESTTPSVYALRGQFRTNKPKAMALNLKQGKQIANYKNINKLGIVNRIQKSNDKENTEEKIEEILDILHDLNYDNKDSLESSTAAPAPTTSTITPLTTSVTNLIAKASNSTENTISKKAIRRKSKSRKGSTKLQTAN